MKLDPITLEIIMARFAEICATMEHVLFHSGYSTILRESHDGSSAICDINGYAVDSSGGPLHLLSFYYTVRSVKEMYPIEQMRDGDCFIHNDPYTGGTLHVPDVLIVTPVFVGGEVIGFVLSHAHKPDVGGLVPGSSGAGSREIFHEGLLLPGVRFWTKDGVVKEVLEIIKTNCRIPEIIEGDLRAQVGCTLMGVQQVRALCDEYGVDTIKAAMPAIMALSEKRLRDGLEAWPDGELEAECFVDHDGVDLDKPLRLHVKIVKKGRDIHFDYSQTNDAGEGPDQSAPADQRMRGDHGAGHHARPDHPVQRRAAPADRLHQPGRQDHQPEMAGAGELVLRPVERALFHRQPGAGQVLSAARGGLAGLGLGAIAIGYDQNRSGRKAVQYELFSSAQGGRSNNDGSSGTVGFLNVTPNTPIEVIETEFPVRVKRFEWIEDSAGAGAHRGGLGNRKEYELLGDATVTLRLGPPVQLRRLGRVRRQGAGEGEGLPQPGHQSRARAAPARDHPHGAGRVASWSRCRAAAGTAIRTSARPSRAGGRARTAMCRWRWRSATTASPSTRRP